MADIPHVDIDDIIWHDGTPQTIEGKTVYVNGHIFKDKLIEAFNFLEEKIRWLATYDLSETGIIDTSNVTYDDLTKEDFDDEDKQLNIINLKSFIDIMDLVNFPLEVVTDNNKVMSVTYTNSDYEIVTKTSENGVTATTSTPWIHLDVDNNAIVASASFDSDKPLLAVLKDNILVTNQSPIPANINFMKILAEQESSTLKYSNMNIQNIANNPIRKNVGGVTVLTAGAAKRGATSATFAVTNFGLTGKVKNADNWSEEIEEES